MKTTVAKCCLTTGFSANRSCLSLFSHAGCIIIQEDAELDHLFASAFKTRRN